MPAHRTVKRLDSDIAAYVAGLVDGEGTITLTREHGCERRRLVLSIANTDRQLLEFVQEKIGAGRITCKRTCSPRHTPSFAYKITSRQALDVLSQIHAYLRTYRMTRAAMALNRYTAVTPRNGRYQAETLRLREEFEREFFAAGPGPRGK